MTLRIALTVAALGFAVVGSAQAQTSDENRDADALAADMRLLAASPNNIEALITAGELTLKMGDATAAAGFFGRAEKLDPLNPRIKAGWGSLLVRAERPGEALRRFQEAELRGLPPVRFAGDRGLAYDLLGQQDRAQRDYRLVLRDHPDDEVTRRYALSLGISGNKDEALKQLDPLLQRSDRAAWRGRAFVLAMNGDASGADRIAMTMMAPGMGAALAPFFRRLPELSPTERAFAVTFGELRASPERVADARMAPSLPQLGPDPYAPRPVVAVAATPVTVANDRDDRRKKRRRKNDNEVAAVVLPAPAPAPALAPPVYVAPATQGYTPPPVYRSPIVALAQSTMNGQALPVVTRPTRGTLPVVTPPPRGASPVVTTPTRGTLPVVTLPKNGARSATAIERTSDQLPTVIPPAVTPPSPRSTTASASPPVLTLAPTPAAAAAAPPPVVVTTAPPVVTPPVVVAAAPPAVPETPQPGVADQPSPAEAGVPPPTAIARVSEDSVLARIVSDANAAPLPAPRPSRVVAAKLAAKAPTAEPAPVDSGPVIGQGKKLRRGAEQLADDAVAKAPVQTRDAKGRAIKPVADLADDKSTTGKDAKKAAKLAADDEPALDKNGCPLPPAKGKSASGKGKAAVAVRGVKPASAAKCKALAAKDKADAEAKGEPARVWVQVAGGANEASLENAWGIMRDRAPALLRGRQGWTTPLRATNRVLTGPFKSEDEAQEFVNKLTKAGVPAFVFTSPKGQKVEKLK